MKTLCRSFFIAFLALVFSTPFVSQAQEIQTPLQRVLFGSCNKEYKPQPLWKPILANKPDLWIWLGDIVYGDARDLADLERRYKIEKAHDEYKTLRESCKIIGMWDDNDFGVEDGGKENPNKVGSQKLLLDFLDEPPGSPRRKQQGVYACYTFGPVGKQVKIVLLDGRYFRDKPGKNADMLGAEQWSWLEKQLIGSKADVNLLCSGIQVLSDQHHFEKWANFPKSRQRLLDLIAKSGARNVILLSGDRHFGEISRMDDPRLGVPLYDITSSGMTHHAESSLKNLYYDFDHEPNPYRVGHVFAGFNFGMITFDWDASPRTATLQIRDPENAVKAGEKLTLK